MRGAATASDESRVRLRLSLAYVLGAVILAAIGGAATKEAAGGVCAGASSDGYSYAGHQATQRGHGVRATITMDRVPSVHVGHVAGWVGVGGLNQSADGRDAWIQAGIASMSASGAALYAEVARPGALPHLVLIQAGVEVDQPHELAILEIAKRPGWWRVWVDGRPAMAPIHMRGSSGRWAPMATAESWNAGTAACNAFGFRFEHVSVSYGAGGSWGAFVPGHRFLDDGTALADVTPSIVHSRAYARAAAVDRRAYSFAASSS